MFDKVAKDKEIFESKFKLTLLSFFNWFELCELLIHHSVHISYCIDIYMIT